MAKTRLTDAFVKALEPPAKGEKPRFEWDDAVPGFWVRVTANGVKTFGLDYRIYGRQRRPAIGRYPAWSAATAREEAKAMRRRVDRGEDPMQERRDAREAPTVRDLFDEFKKSHLVMKAESTAGDYEAAFENHILPRFGTSKVREVSHADVVAFHRAMGRTPHQANRAVAVFSAAMSHAVRWGWRADNPCKGVERFPESRRQRFLSQAEIVKLGEALEAYSRPDTAAAIRFLLLTGARRGEVLSATWGQFDLEKGVWTKPSAHTKQRREHRIPLAAPALAVLAEQAKRRPDEWGPDTPVFPGRKPGQSLVELKKGWRIITEAAGLGRYEDHEDDQGNVTKVWVPDTRPHDLRHSHASILASAGMSLPIIGALLGHTQAQTTLRYSHLFDEPLREAVEHVGRAMVPAGKTAKVTKMRQRAK